MLVEKNKEYIVEIIDNGFEGEGIAKIDNFTIFIPNSIKGETIKIKIIKILSSHAFGKVVEIIKKSPSRVKPDCETYARCGGCNLRHVDYEETLRMKQNAVQSLVNKMLKTKLKVEETLGMEQPYYYRNKVQYPVGIDKNGKPQIGVYATRSHEIIPNQICRIQSKEADKIAKDIFYLWNEIGNSIYNEKTQKGLLRHIVIKAGFKTEEYMAILVINGKEIPNEKEIVEKLISKYPKIRTIVVNSNMKNTNVILGKEIKVIYGDGIIEDKLGDFTFQISPLSFYQVNPVQTEKLYEIGIGGANISKEDIVFDLYCGIGTISLFMASHAKQVYGIEIIEEAIKAAKENAMVNNIQNAEFIAGDVENILDDLIKKQNIIPDIIMVDPPRKGLDNTSIENILTIETKKLTYISCNPSTLVRDLAKLEKKYEIKFIKPVDMFPYTSHVECVALLQLR